MAVDTAGKRASMMRFGRPFIFRLIPDGSIDQADRETLTMKYSGILSSELAVPAVWTEQTASGNTWTVQSGSSNIWTEAS